MSKKNGCKSKWLVSANGLYFDFNYRKHNDRYVHITAFNSREDARHAIVWERKILRAEREAMQRDLKVAREIGLLDRYPEIEEVIKGNTNKFARMGTKRLCFKIVEVSRFEEKFCVSVEDLA